MDREVVRELIQDELNQVSLHTELLQILVTGYRHDIIKKDYQQLRRILGGSGASTRIAEDMVRTLREPSAK
jgi:lipid A disaccharide synthetase